MKIKTLACLPYEIPLTTGHIRSGISLHIIDDNKNEAFGDVAPLPKWSKETLADALAQLHQKKQDILQTDWTASTCLESLEKLELFPSVLFGLESALLTLLMPLSDFTVPVSALLMGSPSEILTQAKLRQSEGYISAKLKVNNLTFDEAAHVIHELKDQFRLRIDVNRAWSTSGSLRFFEQFDLDAFDYVEEPFQNPHDLKHFIHPLAVDESFPEDLSLKQLESLPTLKALIYKPTLQGGLSGCLPLHAWTKKRGVELVLSSSFESDLGLGYVASIAHRLSLNVPVGIGTFHFLKKQLLCDPSLEFSGSHAIIGKMEKC